MKKYLCLVLSFIICNGILGHKEPFQIHIVRGGQPVGEGMLSSDERVIATVVNGVIGDKKTLSTKKAIKKRLFDRFRLPNPLLPLQKGSD